MGVTFVKLLWAFSVSLAGFASVEGYGGVGAGSGSFSSSSSASFSGSAGGAGGGLLDGLFGGEGKLGLGNLQFSASLGGKDGGLLGGLFGGGGGGNFGFGGLGGDSIDGSKDGYGESSVTFGGSGQGGFNAGIRGPGGGYGYGGGNADAGTGGPKNNYGESVSFRGSGQGRLHAGSNGAGGEYGGRGNAAGFAGASVGASTFDQVSGGFYDGVEYDNRRSHPSDATGLSKGTIESGVAGYGGHSTVLAEGFRGSGHGGSNAGIKGTGGGYGYGGYGGIVVSSNSGQSLAERDSKFPNSAQVQGPAAFGGDVFAGTGAAKSAGSSLGRLAESGSVSGSANLGSGGSVSRGVYGNQHIDSGSGLSNGQAGSFVHSGISSGASISVSGENKEKAVERNLGGRHVGGGSHSSTVSGGGVGGIQFGAGIAAEIEKGPKPSIENVFFQGNGEGPSVSSDFQVSGSGGFEAEPKPCSGTSCSHGGENGGGTVHSSTVSGGGVGGIQFGAGIAAEIEKGPKPSIENVFFQGNGEGPSVSSDFQVSGSGGFEAEPKPCSGSSCSPGWDNGGGKVKNVASGGIAGSSTGSFSGSGNIDVGKSIEGEGSIISDGGIGGADSGYGHGNRPKHHNHGHGKKQKVIATVDVDSSLLGFDERSSANRDSKVEFDLSFGSPANTGKGLLGIIGSGGVDGTIGSSYGAGISGSQSGGFFGGSKSCGGYGCGGQGGSEKTIPFGNVGAGASSFATASASASSGTGSYGYGR